jgi:hypothetical protein
VQGFSFRLPPQGPEFDGRHRALGGRRCFDRGGVVLLLRARQEQGGNSSNCQTLFGIKEHPTDTHETFTADNYAVPAPLGYETTERCCPSLRNIEYVYIQWHLAEPIE